FLGGKTSRDIYQELTEIVSTDDLKEGDFVFFKIHRRYISHIGIYLGNNKFVHASRSEGVTISDLDEPYWKRYFYKAGRFMGQYF
ncbi:MAG TPA: NlpC/P60 family protein, partial [Anseongella sp.]|nr:NlpC/P60 family protein [Anseongella sp.]